MLRLIVADDEKYDRDSIINILGGSFKEQLEINEARNGREAIEMAERLRPDIIIMDIKMPGINGLKAIQEIRKFAPNMYFIIISAYDYFDFAVEAVKNNVKEYILKPFSKSELIEKIEEAVKFVSDQKEKRRSEIEDQEKLYNLMPILENELSYSIINDSINSIDYETYMRYLNVDFKNACAVIIQVKGRSNDLGSQENSSEINKIQIGEYIKEYIGRRYKTIGSYRFTENLVYFLQIENPEDEEEIKLNIVTLANDIKREVKRFFEASIRIGIGKCCKGLKEMYKSYCEACSALEYKLESNNVVHFGDLSNEKRVFNSLVENINRDKVALFLDVEQYITDNIKEELELEKVAAKFNLSSSYFSRTFKDIVGYNFSDFINITRINKAKDLLRKDAMSIKEICYTVGYSDPNYFSKVFKKYEGVSPTEFKIK